MIALSLLISVLFPLLLGVSIILLFHLRDKEINKLELTSAGYLLGLGFITLWLFILLLLKIKYLTLATFGGSGVFIISSFIFARKRWTALSKNINFKLNPLKGHRIEHLILFILLLQIVYVFTRALILPPVSWDSFTNWSFKAKILYMSGLDGLIKSPATHLDYPLFNPIAQLWTYLNLGYHDEIFGKLVFPTIYLSFLALFYSQLQKYLSVKIALLVTLVLAIIRPMSTHATIAYADLALTAFYGISVLYLFEFMLTSGRSSIIISALFLGLCAWTKNEGMAFIFVNSITLLTFLIFVKGETISRKTRLFVSYSFLALLIPIFWLVFAKVNSLHVDLFSGQTKSFPWVIQHLNRLPIILWNFLEYMVSLRFAFIWVIFFILHVFYWRKIFQSPLKYLWIIILLNTGVYALVYLITPHDLTWHLRTSLDRIILHYTPVVLFLVALLFTKDGFLVSGEKSLAEE